MRSRSIIKPSDSFWGKDFRSNYIIIMLFAFVLPTEMSIELGGLRLTVPRIIDLIIFPLIMMDIIQNKLKFHLTDLCVFLFCTLIFFSLLINNDLGMAIENGGIRILEAVAPYLAARLWCTRFDGPRIYKLVRPMLVIFLAIFAYEAIFKTFLIRPVIADIFGQTAILQYDYRNGLLRASGPFPHQILASVYFLLYVPIIWFYARSLPEKAILLFLTLALMFFTGSSTGLMGALLQIAILGFTIVTAAGQQRWNYIIYSFTIGFIVLQILTEKGALNFLMNRLSVNSNSFHYRLLIWEYNWPTVMNNMMWGIGRNKADIPAWLVQSIDSFWLAVGVKQGLSSIIVLAVGGVAALFSLNSSAPRTNGRRDYKMRLAMGVLLFTLLLAAFAVDYWETIYGFFFFVLGYTVSLGQDNKAAESRRSRPRQRIAA